MRHAASVQRCSIPGPAAGAAYPGEDKVVMKKHKVTSAITLGALLAVLLVAAAPLAAQSASEPAGFLNFPHFNAPPFDFNDAFTPPTAST
jgi:hypothetical protein